MDYTRLIINGSRYQFRVVDTVPTWTGQEGEVVLYAAGTIRALYSFINGTWVVISWTEGHEIEDSDLTVKRARKSAFMIHLLLE